MNRIGLSAAFLVGVLGPLRAQQAFSPEEVRAAQKDPKAFTLDDSSLRIEVVKPEAPPEGGVPRPPDLPDRDPIGWDEIVNIGERIWTIIENNRPVVDISTKYATALPEGVKNWDHLAGWKPPAGTIFAFTAKNLYGAEVIALKYQVLRTYGGSYKGKGQYLTGVTVAPLYVKVAWGYHLTLKVEVPVIVNAGTVDNPLAAMQMNLKWDIRTVMKETLGEDVYYLQGDGLFVVIGRPFPIPPLQVPMLQSLSLRELQCVAAGPCAALPLRGP